MNTAYKKFNHLICPIDGDPLSLSISENGKSKQLNCAAGHCFDIAKQGYVNLLPVQQKKSLSPGDSKAMIEARSRFLSNNFYQPVLDFLISKIKSLELAQGARILDAGCGDGHYTRLLADSFPQYQFIGLDISKDALKFASNKNDSIDWLVASNSQPPIEPASIDLIICVFGFHSFAGFSKVLKPQGKIILVDPDEKHLIELREEIYEKVKIRPAYGIADAAEYQISLKDEQGLTFVTPELQQNQLEDLLLMTPHLFRATAGGKAKLSSLAPFPLTVDMLFRTLNFNPVTD